MGLQLREGICTHDNCPKRTKLIANRSRMWCVDCNQLELRKAKQARTVLKTLQRDRSGTSEKLTRNPKAAGAAKWKRRKPTGEALFFLALAETRPHRCWVCNEPLQPITFSSMAHVLSKKQFPKFRLLDRNIKFLCPPMSENKCHHKWDNVAHSELREDRNWDKMFSLEEELKEEYKLLK